jgi:hypothetical protein
MDFLAGVFYPDGHRYGQAIPSWRVPVAISIWGKRVSDYGQAAAAATCMEAVTEAIMV